MTQTRKFEINKSLIEDNYTISVDGKLATVKWTPTAFDDLEKYYPGVNVDEEVISMIIHEIDVEFNLSKDELQEYKQTLEYILKD